MVVVDTPVTSRVSSDFSTEVNGTQPPAVSARRSSRTSIGRWVCMSTKTVAWRCPRRLAQRIDAQHGDPADLGIGRTRPEKLAVTKWR